MHQLKDIEQQGYDDYMIGVYECPYTKAVDPVAYAQWLDGWLRAADEVTDYGRL